MHAASCLLAGLIIVCARYGSQLSADYGMHWWSETSNLPAAGAAPAEEGVSLRDGVAVEQVGAANVDVTVPLQFFVKNSTLSLPPGSKSSLLGFYTPASCRPPRASYGLSLRERHRDVWGHFSPNSGWDNARLFGEDAGMDEWSSLPEAQLYIRYEFAGRTFEDTLQDKVEVVLPSPSSIYRGSLEAR